MDKLIKFFLTATGLIIMIGAGCRIYRSTETVVSIKGDKWFINGKIINKGSPAEGLLMNVRMINSVFEDRGDKMPAEFRDFDPEQNTRNFLSKIPEYMASGVNAFTIGLQGGMPGYEGAINSAFESDGELRPEYMKRVAEVIRAVDENSGLVILDCFYQRQHSHFAALDSRDDIKNAIRNSVNWIEKNQFRNVMLEISNEYRHGGFRNWKEGAWLMSTAGQVELVTFAKSLDPSLLVSTSGMGDGQMPDSLCKAVDYITIHFNSTSLNDYGARINELKKFGKPVIANEDDKTGAAGARALMLSVLNGSGWGYMNNRQNQYMPFLFEGNKDDTTVYNMYRNVTTPEYKMDENEFKLPCIIITSPKDGDILRKGQSIPVIFSYLYPDTARKSIIKIFRNAKEAGTLEPGKNRVSILLDGTGTMNLEILEFDLQGIELLRSKKVDIIVIDEDN